MARVFSGIQPTGEVHLGNYLGAVRRWVDEQHDDDAIYCIVDLHALTIPKDPAELRAKVLEVTQLLVAAGLDPEVVTLFAQSHVSEHAELGWIMECTAAFGELRRMTQFKDKSDRADFVSAALFTYPALQAADILLYDTDKVPVGDDQRQHIELARDLAVRFNSRYGDTFVVPAHAIPPVGARVMDLQAPERKMSKSVDSPQGTVLRPGRPQGDRAQVQAGGDRQRRRGALRPRGQAGGVEPAVDPGRGDRRPNPAALAERYEQYGPLKADTAEAVIELLRPVQAAVRRAGRRPGRDRPHPGPGRRQGPQDGGARRWPGSATGWASTLA